MRVWVGPSHCPPSSTGVPSGGGAALGAAPDPPPGLEHAHLGTRPRAACGRRPRPDRPAPMTSTWVSVTMRAPCRWLGGTVDGPPRTADPRGPGVGEVGGGHVGQPRCLELVGLGEGRLPTSGDRRSSGPRSGRGRAGSGASAVPKACMVVRWRSSCRHHTATGRRRRSWARGRGRRAAPTETGLKSEVQGADVAVAQWRGRPAQIGHPRGGGLARSQQAAGVDAGGAEPAVDRGPAGPGERPWARSASIRSAGPPAAAGRGLGRARRVERRGRPRSGPGWRGPWRRGDGEPVGDAPARVRSPARSPSGVRRSRARRPQTDRPPGSCCRR